MSCSGEGHQHLFPSVGSQAGGMSGRRRCWESECCQVWCAKVVSFVHNTQARNVPALLEGLELAEHKRMGSTLHQPLCSSLDMIQCGPVGRWAGGPGKRGVLHKGSHLCLVQHFNSLCVQEMGDAPYTTKLPCSVLGHFLGMVGIGQTRVNFHSKDRDGACPSAVFPVQARC